MRRFVFSFSQRIMKGNEFLDVFKAVPVSPEQIAGGDSSYSELPVISSGEVLEVVIDGHRRFLTTFGAGEFRELTNEEHKQHKEKNDH